MKRFIKIALLVVLVLSLYSLTPLIPFYLKPYTAMPTNDQVIEKLKSKGEYFGFIVFGDNHAGFFYDDSATIKMIRLMNREDRFKKLPIDFVMNLGDVTFYKGRESNYRVYNKLRSMIKWPVISLMGNHDYVKGGGRYFKQYLGKYEFSFTDRNSYFIVLDNKITDLTNEQLAWFEDELKKSAPYRHRFLFMHKPPLSLSQQSWFRPELGAWSYRLMKLCEKYSVDIVFAGHEHMFKERTLGGVRYVISGGGGGMTQVPSSDGAFFHYIVVRVYGDYVDYEVRKVFPPFWEVVTYYMWKDLFYSLKYIFFKEGILI